MLDLSMLVFLFSFVVIFQQPITLCDTHTDSDRFQPAARTKIESSQILCPPWTYPKGNDSDCFCGDSINGIVLCSDTDTRYVDWCDSESSNSQPSVCLLNCYCMSYSEKFDTTIVGECPYLCTSHIYYQIPDSTDKLNTTCSTLIQQSRTGQLCSKCIEGYAPSAYSYGIQCADCTDYHYNWIKYLLIAYLPVTVLYLIVIVFKLNAVSPLMSTYIFTCQMISSPSFMVLASGYFYTQTDFSSTLGLTTMTFLYGVWNLDFFRLAFPPLCLHPSISTLQMISLDYIIALYPLLLMFITYFLVKIHDHSTIAQFLWKPMTQLLHWFHKESMTSISFIEVFCTFFLLSYVKILNTSLNLLTPVQVVNMTGHVLHTYAYYDGSVEYFGSQHLPYAILAICISILFNFLPIVFLCLYPCQCFQFVLNYCQLITFNQRLRTFVDAFQGHYKIEPFDHRYFSVFFLILRIIGLLAFYFIKSGFILLVLGIVFIPITAFYAVMRPYKNDLYNIIDTVFLLVTVMFCFAATSSAFCSLEAECLLFDNTVWVLSAAFPPLYMLIVSVYKLFPKVLYIVKCFNKNVRVCLTHL